MHHASCRFDYVRLPVPFVQYCSQYLYEYRTSTNNNNNNNRHHHDHLRTITIPGTISSSSHYCRLHLLSFSPTYAGEKVAHWIQVTNERLLHLLKEIETKKVEKLKDENTMNNNDSLPFSAVTTQPPTQQPIKMPSLIQSRLQCLLLINRWTMRLCPLYKRKLLEIDRWTMQHRESWIQLKLLTTWKRRLTWSWSIWHRL